MSGSKYETMAFAIEKKMQELDKGASDLVEQKQLEKQRKENQRFSLALDQITRLAASAQDKKKTLQMCKYIEWIV